MTSPPLREGIAEDLVSALKVSFKDIIDIFCMMMITFHANDNTTTTNTSHMMVFLQDGEGLDLVSSDHTGISQAQRAAGQENFTAIPQVGRLDDGDVDHVIEYYVCVHDIRCSYQCSNFSAMPQTTVINDNVDYNCDVDSCHDFQGIRG